MYQAGLGLAKQPMLALDWYRKAAAQQHPVAQNNLGVMYENGIVVAKDRQLAEQWYRKSAEQGYRFAQYNLGNLYADDGVRLADAKKWLTAALNQGVAQAEKRLAELANNQ